MLLKAGEVQTNNLVSPAFCITATAFPVYSAATTSQLVRSVLGVKGETEGLKLLFSHFPAAILAESLQKGSNILSLADIVKVSNSLLQLDFVHLEKMKQHYIF